MYYLEDEINEMDEFNPDDIDFLIEEGICENEDSAKGALRAMRLADIKEQNRTLALCVLN